MLASMGITSAACAETSIATEVSELVSDSTDVKMERMLATL